MPFRACTVTFRDSDGVLQTAKVDADTAFAAAALAMKFWTTLAGRLMRLGLLKVGNQSDGRVNDLLQWMLTAIVAEPQVH